MKTIFGTDEEKEVIARTKEGDKHRTAAKREEAKRLKRLKLSPYEQRPRSDVIHFISSCNKLNQ